MKYDLVCHKLHAFIALANRVNPEPLPFKSLRGKSVHSCKFSADEHRYTLPHLQLPTRRIGDSIYIAAELINALGKPWESLAA